MVSLQFQLTCCLCCVLLTHFFPYEGRRQKLIKLILWNKWASGILIQNVVVKPFLR